MLSQSRRKDDGGCFGGDGGSTDEPSTLLASSCHSRANPSSSFIMKSLVSFARSSQARAFARQYSGVNTPATFSYMISSRPVRLASSAIKCRFVATRRCRVQACPKNGRTEQRGRRGLRQAIKNPAGEDGALGDAQ